MQNLITTRLAEIESANHVKIVYACESGSRAWGFPSANSDYDVRFIYIRPLEWYLSIDEKRDVIEYPIVDLLDISGWDLKKALRLLRKTNPPLLEWLGSPVIYVEHQALVEKLRQFAQAHYAPSTCLYHYLNMARGNFRGYLQSDTVRVKKYFYVLRPLLAMKWIEEERGMAPTDFKIMLETLALPAELKAAIAQLLEQKRAGNEMDKGDRIAVISDFIEQELERWENAEISAGAAAAQDEKLDVFFRECLRAAW